METLLPTVAHPHGALSVVLNGKFAATKKERSPPQSQEYRSES